jgi:hypothetical protein
VREIERSKQQVIVEETATMGAVLVFEGFAVVGLAVSRHFIGVISSAFLAALGLYAAVSSLFIVDRSRRALIVRRRIGPWTFERVYDASAIDRIWVHDTRKGRGLSVRFKSGRNKGLTMSLGSTGNLDATAGALNYFLHATARQ